MRPDVGKTLVLGPAMTNFDPLVEIANSHLILDRGQWPNFHDAEVHRLHIWRGDVRPRDNVWVGPVIEASFELCALENPFLASLRFNDCECIRMQEFNHQNAVYDLRFEFESRGMALDGQPLSPYIVVDFEQAFGVALSFKCFTVEAVARREIDARTPEQRVMKPRITIDRIDHLVLTVASIEACCEFYSSALGMQVVTAGGRKALSFGNQKINLHQHGREFDPKADKPTPGSADICLVTAVPIPDLVSHLTSIGVEVLAGPVQRTGAVGPILSVYFRDPDKNLVEVSNYEPAAARENDRVDTDTG